MLYRLVLLSLSDMSFKRLHLQLISWPTGPVLIKVINDFFIYEDLAIGLYSILRLNAHERSHMFNVDFALLARFFWNFSVYCFLILLLLGGFGFPFLYFLHYLNYIIGRGPATLLSF